MSLLKRNGVDIYFEVHGQGPAMILSHGFSATSRMWQGQIEEFARDHTLILWDMRGHGQSAYPDDPACYGEKQTVDDISALLDEVGADQAVVGGLSLGGYMSLAFSHDYPKRVRALLIIDTGPGYKKDSGRDAWNLTAENTAADLTHRGLEALTTRSKEMDKSQHRDASGLVLAARHMLTQRDARIINYLPQINVPSLVLVGSLDTPFINASNYMAGKIPGAELVVIEGAGHASNIDCPANFNQSVRQFLDRYGL